MDTKFKHCEFKRKSGPWSSHLTYFTSSYFGHRAKKKICSPLRTHLHSAETRHGPKQQSKNKKEKMLHYTVKTDYKIYAECKSWRQGVMDKNITVWKMIQQWEMFVSQPKTLLESSDSSRSEKHRVCVLDCCCKYILMLCCFYHC